MFSKNSLTDVTRLQMKCQRIEGPSLSQYIFYNVIDESRLFGTAAHVIYVF